jgi:hypothetical protein
MTSATEIFAQFLTKEGSQREQVVARMLDEEKIPEWWWNFQPVEVHQNEHVLVYYVSPDYITLGEGSDWLPCPMTPLTCKPWMAKHGFCLPTKKMVDQIWHQAPVKGTHPISYSGLYKGADHNPNRDSTRVYIDQGRGVQRQLQANYPGFIPGVLVAGHKKDVVLTDYLSSASNKGNVAIYGWFDGKTGEVVQGLNPTSHSISYLDYSHGLRMIKNVCLLDGVTTTIQHIWSDGSLCHLLHDAPLKFQSY